MPNYCYAEIQVRGRRECVDEFKKVLEASYDYYSNEFTHKPHFWRIFEVDTLNYSQDGLFAYASFYIECAWSIVCCMCSGRLTYYDDAQKNMNDEQEKLKRLYSGREPYINYSTNIVDLSKALNLDIEIISEESGMCFMEHYRIINGIILVNEYINMTDHYIGDYNSLEDYNNEWPNNGIDLTPEQFKQLKDSGEEWYRQGGIPYDFIIPAKPTYLGMVEMCKIDDEENK